MRGKNYYLFIFYFFISSVTANAQDTIANYMNTVNHIFANVDHSKVTTGLLSDYGLQIIIPDYYNGALKDSNEVDINAFRTLYGDMDNSRFNGNCTLPPQSTVFAAITSNLPSSGRPTPIVSMCINYNELYTNADSTGLVTVSNGQIFDVAGKNPYATKTLFAACPIVISYNTSTVAFILKSILYYSNTGKTITSMAADMGDGSGFRTISWDSPFSATYPSTGNKSFVIKFTFSDGTVLQTHGKIAVNFPGIPVQSGVSGYYSVNATPSFPATTYDAGAIVELNPYGIAFSVGKSKIAI